MCSFTETENMVRDHIIYAMSDLRLNERLLREKDLDLPKAVDMCRAAEAGHAQLKTMTETPLEVNEIHSFRHQGKVLGRAHVPHSEHRSSSAPEGPPTIGRCSRCGYQKKRRNKCPAEERNFNNCGHMGHFTRMCRAPPQRQRQVQRHDRSK